MKKIILASAASAIVLGSVGLFTINASALTGNADADRGLMRGQGKAGSLEARAKILNMTVDELQTALKTKTMLQILEEKGISEATFREKMNAAMEAKWKELGLTDDQIAARKAERETRQTQDMTNSNHTPGSGHGGRHGMFGNK